MDFSWSSMTIRWNSAGHQSSVGRIAHFAIVRSVSGREPTSRNRRKQAHRPLPPDFSPAARLMRRPWCSAVAADSAFTNMTTLLDVRARSFGTNIARSRTRPQPTAALRRASETGEKQFVTGSRALSPSLWIGCPALRATSTVVASVAGTG